MNYNTNSSLLPDPKNKYLRRSRFLNINKRIGTYNKERPKTIEEIQRDEIQNLQENDPKIIKFFEIFTNQNVILA